MPSPCYNCDFAVMRKTKAYHGDKGRREISCYCGKKNGEKVFFINSNNKFKTSCDIHPLSFNFVPPSECPWKMDIMMISEEFRSM